MAERPVHQFVVRATGTNADGRRRSRNCLVLVRSTSPPAPPSATEYVDIVGFAVLRITVDQVQHRERVRDHPVYHGPERLPPAPRSGGAAGALELAERARHQPLRAAQARRPDAPGGYTRWRWSTRTRPSADDGIVLAGVVLAVVAGGAAFFLINNAQQQAGQSGLKTTTGVVAALRDPRPQADRGRGRRPAQRHPARRHERRGRRHRPGPGRRTHPRGRGQAGPARSRRTCSRRRRPAPSSRSSARTRPSRPTPRHGAPCP